MRKASEQIVGKVQCAQRRKKWKMRENISAQFYRSVSNSCCVPDGYNSLLEDPKDSVMHVPLEGAGCLIGSCRASHPQSGLGDVGKTRTFEFHSLENEREMEFCM